MDGHRDLLVPSPNSLDDLGLGHVKARNPEFQACFPCGWTILHCLSQTHEQEPGIEVQQLGLEPAWDAGIAGKSLPCCTTMPALESQVRVLAPMFQTQLLALVHPGRQQVRVRPFGSMPPSWETRLRCPGKEQQDPELEELS